MLLFVLNSDCNDDEKNGTNNDNDNDTYTNGGGIHETAQGKAQVGIHDGRILSQ